MFNSINNTFNFRILSQLAVELFSILHILFYGFVDLSLKKHDNSNLFYVLRMGIQNESVLLDKFFVFFVSGLKF